MKKLQVLFVFLFVIFSIRFFEAAFIDKSFLNYGNFISVLLAAALSLPYFFIRRRGFILPVQLMFIAIVISIVMAYISWGQSFSDSVTETVPYMVWILFFFLLHIKIPVKTIEKIVLFYGVLYVILYFFQLANSPTVFFGKSLYGDKFTLDRGIYRIIFPGAGIFVLATFLSLNKLTTQARGKWFWLIFVLLGIVIPTLQVTRMFMAGVLFIYLLHFIRKQNIVKKVVIMGSFVGIVFLAANINNQIVNGLKSASATNAKQGQDYVRFLSSSYFLTDFSPNVASQVLGNGMPYIPFSNYGYKMEGLNNKGYFMEDDGVIGMYAAFGILSVIAYIMIWYKSVKLKLSGQYLYVKYYLWFLLITCLTTFDVYHPNFLISTVFALYIYQVVYERELAVPRTMTADQPQVIPRLVS